MVRGLVLPLALAAAVLAVLGLTSTFYIVSETDQVLLTRFGRPIGVFSKPGLHVKMPFADNATYYDVRLLPLNPRTEQIILGDRKRIEVDTYTWFRIVNPLRFYQSVRTLEQARSQLTQIVSSSLRRELGQVALGALLSEQRKKIIAVIHADVAERAQRLGIEVADVGIRRADLPPETSQAIYNRMTSERQREAKELRAQGFEGAQEIQARADNERTVALAEAQGQSKIIRGEGDAEANRLFGEAFGGDPKFFAFYRALLTYRRALADAAPTLILSPNAQFLRFLVDGPAAKPAP